MTLAFLPPPAALLQAPASDPSFLDILISGGPVMIPLAVCSVLALAYGFERSLRLRRSRLGDGAFAAQVLSLARAHGPRQALALVQGSPEAPGPHGARGAAGLQGESRGSGTLLAAILRPALERWEAPRAELEKQLEDGGRREARTLVAALRPFSVIAVIAPLLGLLGTVIGIIQAFLAVAAGDAMGRPELLSAGISQALVTTAAGLVIAIPAQALYHWLRGRLDRFVRALEETCEALLALHGLPPAAFAAPIPITPGAPGGPGAPAAPAPAELAPLPPLLGAQVAT